MARVFRIVARGTIHRDGLVAQAVEIPVRLPADVELLSYGIRKLAGLTRRLDASAWRVRFP